MLRYKLGFALLVAVTVAVAVLAVVLLVRPPSPEVAPRPPDPVAPSAPAVQPSATPTTPAPRPTTPRKSRGQHSPPARPHRVPAAAERAQVVDHVDGDTIRLRSLEPSSALLAGPSTSVRLLEIDTPESVDPNKPPECYADEASRLLGDLAPVGSEVWVTADQELLDPYDRTLLYLWAADGRFVNLEMVSRGAAKAVLYEPNDEYIALLRRAESRAREARRGLWAACAFFGQPLADMG